ncbi:hypothetical protein NW768_011844 [Fusarium equiseti]|uniref:pyridoxal 5'-phosphate synthase n=1 Tax=Fusarium equiseti TaxID=61235 RepID=A0ABQ8QWL5_FUSEQ|nr:hypothetical protein NW768_011844 [Fusarium equiseti]
MANTLQSKLRALPVLQGSSHPKMSFGSFPETPQQAFEAWLDEAIAHEVPEPHAVTLSTTDPEGRPDARVLILKSIDHRGWHFAFKAESPKGRQISANNNVALTFYWPKLGRQIRLRGKAKSLPQDECDKDFAARSTKAKVTAMISKQSQALSNPESLEKRLEEALLTHENEEEEISSEGWVVYAVQPDTVEFWQASNDRLHQRTMYSWDQAIAHWTKTALWP